MCRLLSNDELGQSLKAEYSANTINKQALINRQRNIDAFNGIDRKGLSHGKKEKRILLYKTLEGEEIFIQFPGKEATETPEMPLDFRPKVLLKNKTFAPDLSFGAIWDILDEIGKHHNAYLKYVAAVIFHLGYLNDYIKEKAKYHAEELIIKNGIETSVEKVAEEELEWYHLNLSDDIWFTLNDKIGWIDLGEDSKITFEGFVKMVDLLFQNEDCKYFYKNVTLGGNKNYRLQNGRTNSSAANLLILNYLQGNVKISKLLDSFQKSRGVPSFRKADYDIVTNGIVINVDNVRE